MTKTQNRAPYASVGGGMKSVYASFAIIAQISRTVPADMGPMTEC